MRFSILVFVFASAFAHANGPCSSVWVFRAYKTCAAPANGLDRTQPSGEATTLNLPSGWLGGGANQQKVCSDVASAFNEKNLSQGLIATPARPTPIGEEGADRIIQQEYKYVCQLNVQKYAFKTATSPACGLEDKISYKVGGPQPDVQGTQVSCLSCDNFSGAPPAEMVECLHNNIANVVEPKAIELRDSDINAISKQVARVLAINQNSPIASLHSTDQIQFFTDFLAQHPVQNEPNAGWGGLGTKPNLQ